jgi:hypothetical protein
MTYSFTLSDFVSDQIPEKNDLKEERFVSVHSFRGFNPWSPGLLTLWQLGGGEREKERERISALAVILFLPHSVYLDLSLMNGAL